MDYESDEERTVFATAFRGQTVECQTIQDVIGIEEATRVLGEGDQFEGTPDMLESLATLLTRYHLYSGARDLRGWAKRLRMNHANGAGDYAPALATMGESGD